MNQLNPFRNLNQEIAESLPEKIANHLLYKILSGEYAQGERIIEADIIKELNVSNAPVREALYLLQKDGVVERLPRRGVRVKTINDQELSDYLDSLTGLLLLVFDLLKDKWSEEDSLNINHLIKDLDFALRDFNKFNYIQKVASLLGYFVQVGENVAYVRFFREIIFITNVAALTKWHKESIHSYHAIIQNIVNAMAKYNFEEAKKLIQEARKFSFI